MPPRCEEEEAAWEAAWGKPYDGPHAGAWREMED